MNKKSFIFYTILLTLLAMAIMYGTGPQADRTSVLFSNPSKPGLVKVSMISGSISVTGYDGNKVHVEAVVRGNVKSQPTSRNRRLIPKSTTGLTVTEEDNIMKVKVQSVMTIVDLTLQVPRRTSLSLRTINSGDITVNGVSGKFEINNVNGSITLNDIGGSVVGHTTNGHVQVHFQELDQERPLSLSTLNGNIDLAVPSDFAADISAKTTNGEIVSDFEIFVPKGDILLEKDSDRNTGRHRVRIDKTIRGTIQGGGQEVQLKTFNGDILIKKSR